MSIARIAETFSNGKFAETFPFLTESTVWSVVGEFQVTGKDQIIKKCQEIAAYFDSVETRFIALNQIVDKDRVAINGTAEFIRNDKRVNFVNSCDVYVFDTSANLVSITSYCIQDKPAGI